MNEYISKKAILKELDNTINRCKEEPICNVDVSDVCSAISRFIENMQAVDVQSVKHGRWIDIYEYCKAHNLRPSGLEVYYWCSDCDKAEKKTSDFCPNCGARMDGDTNG